MNPPAVANPIANDCLNAASDGLAPDAPTRAGKAAKRFKASSELHAHGLVTTPEHGSQKIYATECAIAGIGGGAALPPGAPAWAVAMLANINARFDNVNARFDNVNDNVNRVNARFDNLDARFVNSLATEHTDPIAPLTNANGVAPDDLPDTFGALLAIGIGDVTRNFLQQYGQPPNPVATRNVRLRKFLGCRM